MKRIFPSLVTVEIIVILSYPFYPSQKFFLWEHSLSQEDPDYTYLFPRHSFFVFALYFWVIFIQLLLNSLDTTDRPRAFNH